ncbi:MAG: TadE/TadG family type IV pilus assembly protein [Caulobacteraceae bacterium]
MRGALVHTAVRAGRRLLRDRRGVAAVEFALVLPMLLFVGLGGYALTDAASTYRKLTDTTVETANVAAQYTTMQVADTQTVMAATAQIMAPYPTSNLSVVLSVITTDANSKATVLWSEPYPASGAHLTKNAAFTLPTNLAQPSTSYVLVQTTYLFTPMTGSGLTGTIPMHDDLLILPRQSPSIPCSDC